MGFVATNPTRYNLTVPRPLSNSALERLGRRLVATDRPEQSDVEGLHVLLSAYSPVLASAVDAVARDIGVVSASRIKNTGTILEKLRRNGGHTLSSIQDLAGLRVVVDGGRAEQDRVVERLTATFLSAARAPRIVDRRARPVQGYRAVHVIVYPDAFRSRSRFERAGSTSGLSGLSAWPTSTGEASAMASRRSRGATPPSKLCVGCSGWQIRSQIQRSRGPRRRSASSRFSCSIR